MRSSTSPSSRSSPRTSQTACPRNETASHCERTRVSAIPARRRESDALVQSALAEPMVKLVILDAELHIERLKYKEDRVSPVCTNARVSEHLDVLQKGR